MAIHASRSSYDYSADPILGAALGYWRAKRGKRFMPSRRDIDPVEVPTLLANLQLIEIVDGRYRFRLVGSELVRAYGSDYTRQYADEFFEGARARNILEVYEIVKVTRQPAFMRSRYETPRGVTFVANRLYLPLSADSLDVNMILGALTFEFAAAASIAGAWGGAARLAGSDIEMVDAN